MAKKEKKKQLKKTVVRKRTSRSSVKSSRKVTKKTVRGASVAKKERPLKKKRTQSARKRIPLVYASDWQMFYAINGAALRSMNDLFNELGTMLDHEYLYHKGSGDHFTIWVREVLHDDACAMELSKAVTREKARRVLKKYLKRYNV